MGALPATPAFFPVEAGSQPRCRGYDGFGFGGPPVFHPRCVAAGTVAEYDRDPAPNHAFLSPLGRNVACRAVATSSGRPVSATRKGWVATTHTNRPGREERTCADRPRGRSWLTRSLPKIRDSDLPARFGPPGIQTFNRTRRHAARRPLHRLPAQSPPAASDRGARNDRCPPTGEAPGLCLAKR